MKSKSPIQQGINAAAQGRRGIRPMIPQEPYQRPGGQPVNVPRFGMQSQPPQNQIPGFPQPKSPVQFQQQPTVGSQPAPVGPQFQPKVGQPGMQPVGGFQPLQPPPGFQYKNEPPGGFPTPDQPQQPTVSGGPQQPTVAPGSPQQPVGVAPGGFTDGPGQSPTGTPDQGPGSPAWMWQNGMVPGSPGYGQGGGAQAGGVSDNPMAPIRNISDIYRGGGAPPGAQPPVTGPNGQQGFMGRGGNFQAYGQGRFQGMGRPGQPLRPPMPRPPMVPNQAPGTVSAQPIRPTAQGGPGSGPFRGG